MWSQFSTTPTHNKYVQRGRARVVADKFGFMDPFQAPPTYTRIFDCMCETQPQQHPPEALVLFVTF